MDDVDLGLKIARAVCTANAHVHEVFNRPHINAKTASNRVDLYLTSLRRCLWQHVGGPETKNLVKWLCRHSMWSDAGVLSDAKSAIRYSYVPVKGLADYKALIACVEFADMVLSDEDDAKFEECRRVLDQLAQTPLRLELILGELRNKVKESEPVACGLIQALCPE